MSGHIGGWIRRARASVGKINITCGLLREPSLFPGVDVIVVRDRWLVVTKPVQLLIHRTRPFSQPNLIDNIAWALGESVYPVNRLDRVTSGLVLLGRDAEAAGLLGRLFGKREVEKTYLAISYTSGGLGLGPGDHFVIDAPIGMDTESPIRVKRAVVAEGEGAAAVTEVRVLGVDGGMIWMACRPRTGRTHQIRCHLAHLRIPIVGDLIYGTAPDEYIRRASGVSMPASPWIQESPRLGLHAWRLAFEDPTQAGRPRVVVHAAVPLDFPKPRGIAGFSLDWGADATRQRSLRDP